MKQEADFFDGKEPKLLYIAKKLRDALAVEKILTDAGVDYGVETDLYRGGFIFQSERVGAFFYVLEEALEPAQQALIANRYKPQPPE